MNADQPRNTSSDAPEAGTPGAEPSRPRLYDSFIVRLWRDEGAPTLLRAEIEHIQAGLFLEELHVPLSWVLSTIESCLRVPESPPDAPSNHQPNAPGDETG